MRSLTGFYRLINLWYLDIVCNSCYKYVYICWDMHWVIQIQVKAYIARGGLAYLGLHTCHGYWIQVPTILVSESVRLVSYWCLSVCTIELQDLKLSWKSSIASYFLCKTCPFFYKVMYICMPYIIRSNIYLWLIYLSDGKIYVNWEQKERWKSLKCSTR